MDAVVLGGCLLAAMLTHYFAAGAALAIGISAIFLRSGSARRNALIAIGGAGLLYLILWGPAMLEQRSSFHRNLGAVLDITGQTSLMGRIGVAIVSQISKHSPESMALTIAVVLALIVACFLQPRRRESLVAILWLICTVVLFIVIDTRGGSSTLTVARYGTLFAPAIFLLVAGRISRRELAMAQRDSGAIHGGERISSARCVFAVERGMACGGAGDRAAAGGQRHRRDRVETIAKLVARTIVPGDLLVRR